MVINDNDDVLSIKPRKQNLRRDRLPDETVTIFSRIRYHQTSREEYRIANTPGYIYYMGVNALPDLTIEPNGFSATLPISIPRTLTTEEIIYLVLRKRNQYGMDSRNQKPYIITLTGGGPVNNQVTAPQNLTAYPLRTGEILLNCNYPELNLDLAPADKIKIWVSPQEPNPASSPTQFVDITSEEFSLRFGNYSPGSYNVMVALFRSSDSELSQTLLTTVVFPDLPQMPLSF